MKTNYFFAVVCVASIFLNYFLFQKFQTAKATANANRAALVKVANDYRAALIQIKTEHPIIFQNLQIPPAVE